jgi:hypothetical protein
MSKATEQQLGALHGLLATSFASEIKAYVDRGEPIPASVLAAAARFLKDNGIDAPARNNKELDLLATELEDLDFDDTNVVALTPR